MNKLIIFQDPDVATACRAAGWPVFRQVYNGQVCFAVEENEELLQVFPILRQDVGATFNRVKTARARTLHF